MCTYNTKRAFRAISHSLLKSILASKAPNMRIPWNRVTQRKIEPLYAEFLKLDDGLRAEIDSVLYEICSVTDCPVNATTLHVQIQQHSYVVTVDRVEEITGLDFFSLLPQPLQEELESTIDINAWDW